MSRSADHVEATLLPVLLVGHDLCVVGASPSWQEAYGSPTDLMAAPPFSEIRDAEVSLRSALEEGTPATLVTSDGALFSVIPVVPQEGEDPAPVRLLVMRDERQPTGTLSWGRRAIEVASTPTYLVGPRGRILFANGVARKRSATHRLSDICDDTRDGALLTSVLGNVARGQSVRLDLRCGAHAVLTAFDGLVLVELHERPDPGATIDESFPGELSGERAYRLRSDLQDLVGHLEVIRSAPLSSTLRARADCALEKALEMTNRFSGGDLAGGHRQVTLPHSAEATLAVLVVDDNPVNRHVVLSMLRTLGVHADAADSADEALRLLSMRPYDLLLMDVMMPNTDGTEVTRKIREAYGERPFIVGITANPDARALCLDAGMNAFYAKPLRIADVSEALGLCTDEA